MRLLLILVLFLLIPGVSLAVFERDLFYGLRDDSDVKKLQEFLSGEGVYTGPVTGIFLNLTKEAVKKFQEREKILPSAGYFGPISRGRANQLLSQKFPKNEGELLAQIANLQNQLKLLQIKLAEETAQNTPVLAPVATSSQVSAIPVVTNAIIISGSATSTFPAIETSPFKIGTITVKNSTSKAVTFTNFEILLSDEMDSLLNRNNRVFFLLRDGLNPTDTLISKTEFTFFLTTPVLGSPHKIVLKFPFAVTMNAGEEKIVTLWVEQFKYVRSGTLGFQFTQILATEAINVSGAVNLILTKEPPL